MERRVCHSSGLSGECITIQHGLGSVSLDIVQLRVTLQDELESVLSFRVDERACHAGQPHGMPSCLLLLLDQGRCQPVLHWLFWLSSIAVAALLHAMPCSSCLVGSSNEVTHT